MRSLVWDRPTLTRRHRDRARTRPIEAPDARHAEAETELAFHKVWLARALRTLPKPRPRSVDLPVAAATDVAESIESLRVRSGLSDLPRRPAT